MNSETFLDVPGLYSQHPWLLGSSRKNLQLPTGSP